MADRRRIMYVDLAQGVGGSLVSLSLLVAALDRERYEPEVILIADNPYCQRFRDLGVRVLTVPGRPGLIAPGPDAPVVASARRSRLAAWLRRGRRRAAWLHGVGFVVRNLPAAWSTARAVRRILERERPALIHLNDAVAIARAGAMAALGMGIPTLAHVRAFTPLNSFDRWLARRVDGFIFISQATADFQSHLGVRARRSWIIPNGLDLATFAELPSVAAARARLGLPTEGPVVGTVGRLVAWKGHDVFLRALAQMAPAWPGLRGLIVGAPEKHDLRPEAKLRALAAGLGLAERVCFTGYRSDVPQVLPAMDVFVHAAVEPEPFGRVIIEAMAARVPVVAACAGAVPEIMDDGATGLLVAPGDVTGLAAAVARLLEDRALARRLAEAGRQRVEQCYTAQGTALAVQRVYEEVLCSG